MMLKKQVVAQWTRVRPTERLVWCLRVRPFFVLSSSIRYNLILFKSYFVVSLGRGKRKEGGFLFKSKARMILNNIKVVMRS